MDVDGTEDSADLPSSALLRLFEATDSIMGQQYESSNLSLVVTAIDHYVLDATSTAILIQSTNNATNNSNNNNNCVVPFSGYDLIVSDGKYQTKLATADLHIASLIQKSILKVGSVISRVVVKMCFSERRSHYKFFLLTDISLASFLKNSPKRNEKELPWLPCFDKSSINQPLLSLRLNYLSPWNITDPVGSCWDFLESNSPIPRITESKNIPRGYSLAQMLVTKYPGSNYTPLLVRVFAKSRLNYYARKRMDIKACPYQFDLLVGDNKSCCLAVFWDEIAVQAYKQIDIGSMLLIHGYRIKPSFKTKDYSACCFNPAIERFNLEISLNDKPSKIPFDIVEPSALTEVFQLPSVPFNFTPASRLFASSPALNDVKFDIVGMIAHAGRWNREARRNFRSFGENDEPSSPPRTTTQGLVVSSLSGDKYLEEFHTGGYWMWRWLLLVDDKLDNKSIVRIKYYCSSQPDVQYALKPTDVVAITQLRFVLMNKSEAANSRHEAKWALTTTNESQVTVISSDLPANSPFLKEAQVRRVNEVVLKEKERFQSSMTFGGSFDFPNYPDSFDKLVERFSPTEQQSTNRELVGPVYVAAPQLAALVDGLAFLEQRALVVHGLVVSASFIAFDEVIRHASNLLTDNGRETTEHSSSTSRPKIDFTTSWQDRQVGFRGIGIDVPHWRTLSWFWQSRNSELLLKKYVNLPEMTEEATDKEPSGTRLHLHAASNFIGYLHVQILLLNQAVYLNTLVPVPESACSDETFAHALASSDDIPSARLVDFINSCCADYDMIVRSHPSSVSVRKMAPKTFRTFFSSISSPSSSDVNYTPSKAAAVLNCYGLGSDGVEITLKGLYFTD